MAQETTVLKGAVLRTWAATEEVDRDRATQISIKTFLTVVESTLVAIISLRSEVLVGLGAMELES